MTDYTKLKFMDEIKLDEKTKMYKIHKIEFDVIYDNNTFIFYNSNNNEFIGQTNIIYSQRETNNITNYKGEIFKIRYTLENSFINNNFYIKNVETKQYLKGVRVKDEYAPTYTPLVYNDLNYLFSFELIGETPKTIQNQLRDLFQNTWNIPLIDY